MIDVLIFRCTSCQSARPQRDQFGNSMGLRFLFFFFLSYLYMVLSDEIDALCTCFHVGAQCHE